MDERRRRAVMLGALALLGGFAIWRVLALAWTCDDAFISYRYAQNLVRGHGLVFNAGERVEGYTNFLFTLAIAATTACGAEPRLASMLLGGAAYLAVAVLLVRWSARAGAPARAAPSLAACLWLAQDDLHAWATGGLETTVFAAFALGGLALVSEPALRPRSALLGGCWLALACLTRPDGLLFAAAGVVAPLVTRPATRGRLRAASGRCLTIAAPISVTLAAYAAFKLAYYGRLLPTTFYAKSAARAYYAQGLVYVGLYFVKHWATLLACAALPAAVLLCARWPTLRARRDAWFALATFSLFSAYVAHSGGDYMFARRLVPALPLLFVFLDAAAAALPAALEAGSVLALAAASLLPYRLLPTDQPASVHGITDERLHYPERLLAVRKRQGLLAREIFGPLQVRAAFAGGMCAFAYYSELPYLVEPNGLTQYWIAEQPLAARGTIGHEKGASLDALRAHDILLIFHHDVPPLRQPEPRFDEVLVGRELRVELLRYSDALMNELAASPRVRFKPIHELLAEAALDLRGMSCADGQATLSSLSRYYLDQHPAAREPLARALSACRAAP